MFDQEVSKNNKSVRSVGVQTEGNNDKNLKSLVAQAFRELDDKIIHIELDIFRLYKSFYNDAHRSFNMNKVPPTGSRIQTMTLYIRTLELQINNLESIILAMNKNHIMRELVSGLTAHSIQDSQKKMNKSLRRYGDKL